MKNLHNLQKRLPLFKTPWNRKAVVQTVHKSDLSGTNDHDSDKEEIESSLEYKAVQINTDVESCIIFTRDVVAMVYHQDTPSGWFTEHLFTLDRTSCFLQDAACYQ